MKKEKSDLMDCIKVGNLISKFRKEKGLTQKELADKLGIQSKTVSKWECGWGCPDASYWVQLSDILGVDISNMLEGQIVSNKPDNGNTAEIFFLQQVPFPFSAAAGNSRALKQVILKSPK